jgi:hypothetical protein
MSWDRPDAETSFEHVTEPLTVSPRLGPPVLVALRFPRRQSHGVLSGGPDPGPIGDLLLLLTRQPEPPALVTSETACYNITDLESGGSVTLSATIAAVTIGRSYHI